MLTITRGLEAGFLLDRQWHLLRGEMEGTKRPTLMLLARVLAEEGVPYAIIRGVALQVHQADPRTTLDIDLAVGDAQALLEATPELAGELAPAERALLDQLPR
jgi:hypothetical protein